MCSPPRTPNELGKRCGTVRRAIGKSFFNLYSRLKERATFACQTKCTRHQSTTTCPRNVLTMDVWCEGEMGVATDVSIPPSVGPARSLAPLTSFTLFVHTAPLCANIANPFQIGCAIVQNFFAGLRPTPRQGSRPGPQKGNYCDNILLPGRVGNYWTNIFDKFRDPYPLPASLTPCSCTWCVREDIITGRKDRVA